MYIAVMSLKSILHNNILIINAASYNGHMHTI